MKERTTFDEEINRLVEIGNNSLETSSFDEVIKPNTSGPSVTLSPLRARILWPALGFPSVVNPREKESINVSSDGDATNRICILLISNRKDLSKKEASRYLRYVPWNQRGRRHIILGGVGSFSEEELQVINYHNKKSPVGSPKDKLGELIVFGANHDGINGIVANLAIFVKDFYKKHGMIFLNEIRVYETAARKLVDGLYHLFLNNESSNENSLSDELNHLLQHFATPRRKSLGNLWKDHQTYLMDEYKYEYGSIHLPYSLKTRSKGRIWSEILHPLFIRRNLQANLKIGHLTDTHVDVRADVYEENLRFSSGAVTYSTYNNWNKNFVNSYTSSKKDSDIILLTGDLIDYGRGHWGLDQRDRLADDSLYQVDRNWFLFNYLLASENAYSVPVYTILGNHDWRLNPYPPFAIAGAPSPRAIITDAIGITPQEQKAALIKAHLPGIVLTPEKKESARKFNKAYLPGPERLVSYNDEVESKYHDALKGGLYDKIRNLHVLVPELFDKIKGNKTMNRPGFPTETSVESVAWYLLSINPFLDYQFTLPSGHSVLMLDWAEEENVFFPIINRGRGGFLKFNSQAADEGPKAKNSLTSIQVKLVKVFLEEAPGTKIIGIHAPPIGPWDNWYDDELRSSWKESDLKGRGNPYYIRTIADKDGKTIKTTKGHPLFSISPKKVPGKDPSAKEGMDAILGTFEINRAWFITQLANQKYNVRIVLSGHIHRKGLFVTYKASEALGKMVAGEMLIKSVFPNETRDVRSPAGAQVKIQKTTKELGLPPGPLYINSTSIGPRGHLYLNPRGPVTVVDSQGKVIENKPLDSRIQNIYIPPGYTHIELIKDGTIKLVEFRSL